MRDRSTVSPTTYTSQTGMYYPMPSGSPTLLPARSWYNTTYSQRIIDDPKRSFLQHGRRRLQVIKPVFHQIWRSTLYEEKSTIWANWNYSGKATISGPWQYFSFIAGLPADTDFGQRFAAFAASKLGDPLAEYSNQWDIAKPTMTTRASLGVFLWELREIVQLFKIIPQRSYGRTWASLIKYPNDLHLNYNFGWKPFVRDIRATYQALQSFDSRLEKFLFNQDQLLRKNVRWDPVTETVEKTVYDSGFWKIKERWTKTETYTSTFQFTYNLPYSPNQIRWRALLDSVGLNVGIKDIWAVVPYSFVWDWFFPISDLLDQDSDDWLRPYLNWLQACSGHKALIDYSTWIENVYGERLKLCDVTLSQYRRILGLPESSWKTGTLTADKIRLGASLIAGKIL